MTQFSAVVKAGDIVLSLPWNDIQVQVHGYFSIFFSCIGCTLPIDTKAGFCQCIFWLGIYRCLACQLSHSAKMFQLYLLWGSDSYQKSDNFQGGT